MDIEGLDESKLSTLQRALTEEEQAQLLSLEEDARADYLLAMWTAKESIFKKKGEGRFVPSKISVAEHTTLTKVIETAGERLTLSLATEDPERLRCFFDIKLKK